jgi:hypothetical protein
MTYTSKDVDPECHENDKHSKIKFIVKCDATKKRKPDFKFPTKSDQCVYTSEIEHEAGCALNLGVILGLKKFIGIISIVVGLALRFAGSKFIPIALGVLLVSNVFFFCFLIGAVVIKGTGAMIGLTVVCLILGGAAGYFGYKVLVK